MLFLFHLTFYETTERLTTSFQETSLCLQLRARQDSAEFCVFLRVVGEKHNNNDPIKSNDKHKIEKFISFSSNCSHDLHGRLKSLFFSYLQPDICLWTKIWPSSSFHSLCSLLNPGRSRCIHRHNRTVPGDHASGFEGPFIDYFFCCAHGQNSERKGSQFFPP